MKESAPNIPGVLSDLYQARIADVSGELVEDDYNRFMTQLTKGLQKQCIDLSSIRVGLTALTRIPKIIRVLNVNSINLYENVIGDSGMQTLSQIIISNRSITHLNVGCNDISDGSVMCLTDLIKNTNIQSLQLGRKETTLQANHFSREGLIAIIDTVPQKNQLKCLGLRGASLVQARPLAHQITVSSHVSTMLQNCSSLSTLDISSLNFEEGDSIALSRGFSANQSLRILIASDNHFLNYRAITGICQISSLLYLDLSRCQIKTSSLMPLVEALDFSTLHLISLNLSENKIDSDGAIALFQVLEKNDTLTELYLSYNSLTSKIGSSLSALISQTQILDILDLSKNNLGDETAFLISAELGQNQSISTLKLGPCKISDAGATSIASSLQFNRSLKHLTMKDNFINTQTGFEIVDLLKGNEMLTVLDFSSTAIDKFAADALTSICRRNRMLRRQEHLKPLRKEYMRLRIQKAKIPLETGKLNDTEAELDLLTGEIDGLNAKIESTQEKMDQELGENAKASKEFEDMTLDERKAIDEMEKQLAEVKAEYAKEVIEIRGKTEQSQKEFKEILRGKSRGEKKG